ncbi:MAG: phage baseplate protein [Chloroflexi bacterium]|nr:phage baseplate protein [Chloroflexota bacterium]
MRSLNAADIVTIWDRGQAMHPIDRALLLLTAALPEADPVDLQNLTIGQRNGRLLHLRQLTIGDELAALVNCPQCGATLEFSLTVSQLQRPEPTTTSYTIILEGQKWRLRLPTSADLSALLSSPTIDHARQQLVARCVQPDAGQPASPTPTASILAEIARSMAETDPQADMRFSLTCADCAHEWQSHFDVVAFFWAELAAQARRLLLEVHQIARAYGWREPDILALSSRRRHLYLEMIGA